MRRVLVGLFVGVVVVMAGAVTSPSASQEVEVTEVRGSAFGLFGDLDFSFPDVPNGAESEGGPGSIFAGNEGQTEGAVPVGSFEFGPAPEVVLPPEGGGPITDSLTDVVLDFPEPFEDGFVESFVVSTEGALGAAGFARSSSETGNADVGGIFASSITSECEATSAGRTGSSELLDLVINDTDLGDLTPEPNTVLDSDDIPGLGDDITLTLNAQETIDADGVETLVVTGLRIDAAEGGTSPSDGIMEISQSTCGVLAAAQPAAPVAVTPAFTG